MGRQAVGALPSSGPFDGSPMLCYAQKPLCASTVPNTSMDSIESAHSMGQHFVIAVCPFDPWGFLLKVPRIRGCNQNDSIVLNKQSIHRGLGSSLAFHNTRFNQVMARMGIHSLAWMFIIPTAYTTGAPKSRGDWALHCPARQSMRVPCCWRFTPPTHPTQPPSNPGWTGDRC